jgi:hypothetical protein
MSAYRTFDRSFYRPKMDPTYTDPDLGIEVYEFEERGRFLIKAFAGKRAKADIYEAHSTAAARDVSKAAFVASIEANRERKSKARSDKTAFRHDVKIGDIFRTSWGYEQTNVDFYEVTALIGQKMVEVREICSASEDTGYLSGNCVPVPGRFAHEVDHDAPRINGRWETIKPKAPHRVLVQPGPYIRVDGHSASREVPITVAGITCFAPSHWSAYA